MKGASMDLTDADKSGSDVDVRTAERIADAPLPTGAKLRMRQNLPVQMWRFVRINLKTMRIIFSGHH